MGSSRLSGHRLSLRSLSDQLYLRKGPRHRYPQLRQRQRRHHQYDENARHQSRPHHLLWRLREMYAGRRPCMSALLEKVTAKCCPLLKMYAAAGTILGHNFPFYLQFHGGKGIAATAGLVLSFDPIMSVLGIITFFGIFFTTHYVSLGSLLV